MHIARYKNSREAVLDSEASKQEVKEFVASRPCSRCEGMSRGGRVSRYLQPVGVTFICLTNMARLPLASTPFSRVLSDSVPETVTQAP